MKNFILICLVSMMFQQTMAQIVNGGFENYTCVNIAGDPFFNSNCGTSPWKRSHGTAQIVPTLDNNIDNQWCARVSSADNIHSRFSPPRNNKPGEGLIYEYNFQKGKAYKLDFRFKAYVDVVSPGDNNSVDQITIQLCNGLPISTLDGLNANYNLPNRSSSQNLFTQTNIFVNAWQTQSIIFYPVRDFSQLMFYCFDNCVGDGLGVGSSAHFMFDDVKLSCGPSNSHITSTIPVGLNQSSDKLSLSNTNTVAAQSYTFAASQEVTILPNTTITAGSDALVKIGGLNCAAEPSVCASPSALFIPNLITPNGDGLNDTWKVLDQSKPNYAYSSYKIYYEIYNRWGTILFCRTAYAKDYGMSGFPSGAMEWDGAGVSDGVYYYYMRLYNCSPPNGFQCSARARRGEYCYNCIRIITGEEEDLGFTEYNSWVQVAGSSARAASEPFEENSINEIREYLKVYPNPVRENINFELKSINDNDFYQMTLIDLSGKEVMQTEQQSLSGKTTGQWNIETLHAGLYQLKVRTATKVWVNKIEIVK